jgi:hypothetical protein
VIAGGGQDPLRARVLDPRRLAEELRRHLRLGTRSSLTRAFMAIIARWSMRPPSDASALAARAGRSRRWISTASYDGKWWRSSSITRSR